MTPTAAQRVLVAGRDAGGPVLNCDTVETPAGGGASAAAAAARVVETVMRTRSLTAENGRHLHTIGVTWTDDAVAEAALVLEKLADAGLGNVVPVRLQQAVEAVETGAAVTAGHGAAVVAVQSVAYSDAAAEQAPADPPRESAVSRQYTGAVAALVVGALSFVVSLSLAVSLQNTPEREVGPIERVANTTETVADQKVTPPAAPLDVDDPAPLEAPAPPEDAPEPEPAEPAELGSAPEEAEPVAELPEEAELPQE